MAHELEGDPSGPFQNGAPPIELPMKYFHQYIQWNARGREG